MKRKRILPCVCGEIPNVQHLRSGDDFRVICPKCLKTGMWETESSLAIDDWNFMISQLTNKKECHYAREF